MVRHETYQTILCILAFFCPPLAILIHCGCNSLLLINALLTILGIIPGMIHAWWVICYYDEPFEYPDRSYVRHDTVPTEQ